MADGAITFSTALDNKDLERDLDRLGRKIETLEDKLFKQKQLRMPIAEQAERLGAELDAANVKLAQMQSGGRFFTNASITAQAGEVKRLEVEFNAADRALERCNAAIKETNINLDRQKEKAGSVVKQLAAAGSASNLMGDAVKRAGKSLDRFKSRLKEVVRSALVFTLITQALAKFREWAGKVVRSNDEASAAVARLKGALLVLAQPLVEIIIPAFTTFVNILADIAGRVAEMMSVMFDTTVEESTDAAEGLYNEQEAIEGVEKAANKASASMANFDRVNKLSGDNASTEMPSGGAPDFSNIESMGWLKKTMGDAAGYVTDALLLGGIALVAIGASKGNLPLIMAGLSLLGAGIVVGGETGALRPWAEALGLDNVQLFVTVAITLAGIALIAIGAAMGNILLLLAGLALIWGVIAYSKSAGMAGNWTQEQVSQASSYITAALLLAGIVLIAIGAATANILMVLSGLVLLAAGIYVGVESGTLESWADALGLNSVFDQIVVAIQLAGIALIAIGAAMNNIFMVLAGAVILGVGISAQIIGEETLKGWWEVLKLTTVQQWVSVALLLVGIALVAIGAAMGNVLMVLAGAVFLVVGVVVAAQENNLKNWVDTLGLQQVVGWVTAALLLAGMAFLVFGIVTGNILMIVAGVGLLAAGVAVGASSGTFKSWVEALQLEEVQGWVTAALLLAGIALVAIGAMTLNPLLILAGLGLLGSGIAVSAIGTKPPKAGMPQVQARNLDMSSISSFSVPALARGAVIPPNREFLAVLGDQPRGMNYEVPDEKLRQLIREETAVSSGGSAPSGDIVLTLDGAEFARVTNPYLARESKRVGVKLVSGV